MTRISYFDVADCDLDAFREICSRTLSAQDVPQAHRIEKNVAIYRATDIAPKLAGGAARRGLLAEWARQLRDGSGIFVIKGAYADTAIIDLATEAYLDIIAREKEGGTAADHFAAAGANDRVWNSLQKLCEAAPEVYARYFGNPFLTAASEAWLGPNFQMTAQVNLVHPGGAAQKAHRDYHLGFMSAEQCAAYPAHVHDLSPVLTLQGAIAHCDMTIQSGPTKLLPFSQTYRAGYAAWRLDDFRAYFEESFIQLPLEKGDLLFFSPALFHAAGENQTKDFERFVNLVQVSSAMGRAMETIDRRKMCELLYPVLLGGALKGDDAAIEAAIACTAEGYSFPTNLDRDPPVGGLAPVTQAQLFQRALAARQPAVEFNAALADLAQRQSS